MWVGGKRPVGAVAQARYATTTRVLEIRVQVRTLCAPAGLLLCRDWRIAVNTNVVGGGSPYDAGPV